MSLILRVQALATRVAAETKTVRTLVNGNTANLTTLTTTAKSNLVAAINELDAELTTLQGQMGAQINDVAVTSSTQTWSVDKIKLELQAYKDSLTTGAAAALDTLAEIGAALGNDANFAATVTTALGNRVRYDASQTLTGPQQLQARSNIGAAALTDVTTLSDAIGDPETDFVATFNAGLI